MAATPRTGHVFISYRQTEPDKQFAHRLAYDLQAAGHPVWIDVQGIEAGQTWNTEIQGALDVCYAYVVVLSPEAMKSQWVRNELLYALREKAGMIFPVLLIDVKLPPEIIAIQYVDFRYDYGKALNELLANLPVPPAEGASQTPQVMRLPEAPPKRRLPLWMGALAALAVLGLILGLGALFSNGATPATPTATLGTPGATIAVQPTQTETATPTTPPTDTPTATPIGPNTPITFVFLSDPVTSPQTLAAARALTAKLSERTGYTIQGEVETDEGKMVADLCNHKTQVSILTALGYLLAKEQGECAVVSGVMLRAGSRYYASQIVAKSGTRKITDLVGKPFCRVEEDSASGWIMQMLLLKSQGVDPDKDFTEIKSIGDHKGVVVAVYNGDCAGGATFSDARYNAATDLPDVWSKVIVLEPTTTNIPNDALAISLDVPTTMREKIVAELIKMAADTTQVELLRSTGGWSGLERADPDLFNAYDALGQLVRSSGYNLKDIVK